MYKNNPHSGTSKFLNLRTVCGQVSRIQGCQCERVSPQSKVNVQRQSSLRYK